jgi:hypothetical protein
MNQRRPTVVSPFAAADIYTEAGNSIILWQIL